MPKVAPDKVPTACRLTDILRRLNQGEKLATNAMSVDYRVTRRTIQRDFTERLSFFTFDEKDGFYSLPTRYLGKLDLSDLERFAQLAGVRGLFPALNNNFLSDFLDTRLQSALLIKGHQLEDLSGKEITFSELERAIVGHFLVTFNYSKTLKVGEPEDQGRKTYIALQPYKLVNHCGIWYVAAKDGVRLKSFTFSNITRLDVLPEIFEPDSAVYQTLQEEDSIWHNEKTEVVLKVDAAAAGYFKRRKLISCQITEKELSDGGLIISGRIADANQILPTVRYWLPHVRVISPEHLQVVMEQELRAYLGVV